MYKKTKRVKPLVENILSRFPDTRDSDMKLILKVWSAQGLVLSADQVDAYFKYCSPPESVRRSRQSIQEGGEYPSSKKVTEERARLEVEMRENI